MIIKFAGDIKVNGIQNKVSILLDTKKPLHISVPVPVIDCSGTGSSAELKWKYKGIIKVVKLNFASLQQFA